MKLCTNVYSSHNKLISDALRVESSKRFFSKFVDMSWGTDSRTPMNISNMRLKFKKQRERDRAKSACFYCHDPSSRLRRFIKSAETRMKIRIVILETTDPCKTKLWTIWVSCRSWSGRKGACIKIWPDFATKRGKKAQHLQQSQIYHEKSEVLFFPLMEFHVYLERIPCSIMKDDGASTNIIYRQF